MPASASPPYRRGTRNDRQRRDLRMVWQPLCPTAADGDAVRGRPLGRSDHPRSHGPPDPEAVGLVDLDTRDGDRWGRPSAAAHRSYTLRVGRSGATGTGMRRGGTRGPGERDKRGKKAQHEIELREPESPSRGSLVCFTGLDN
jgi:hypothetical protein